VLPIVVGALFLAAFVGLLIAFRALGGSSSPSPASATGATVSGIRCDPSEQLAEHYHAHLTLIDHGQAVTVPAGIGLPGTCFYWLHTHTTTGIIHIEAPVSEASRQFTLGDFFHVWGQPLSAHRVAGMTVGAGDSEQVWVDGAPYTGDLAQVPLRSHTQVVIEVGPPFRSPPPSFDWTAPAAVAESGRS